MSLLDNNNNNWYTVIATGEDVTPRPFSPVANYLIIYVNQEIGHMVQTVDVVYGTPNILLAVQVKHLCVHGCRRVEIDQHTGYRLGWWCKRPTPADGLRICDICDRYYINKLKYQDPNYETNCPSCIKEFGLDDEQ